MYLSISAYTESRKLIKAIRRFYNTFESFQKEIESLEIQDTTYDGIIISLVDEDEDYFKETPNKDRIYDVDVGISNNLSLLPNEDIKFFSFIHDKIEFVLDKCKLEQSDKEKIKDVILSWKNSL